MAVKKKKLVERGMRGVRAAKGFVKNTQARAQVALGNIEAGAYNTDNLLDDVMEQATDFMDAFVRPFRDGATPSVFFAAGAAVPPPATVALADSVKAQLIDKSDLAGIARLMGADTAILFGNANYQLRDPDTNAVIGAGSLQELDEVVVEILAMPANQGIYRGVLTLGQTKVLAEVIVVRK